MILQNGQLKFLIPRKQPHKEKKGKAERLFLLIRIFI